jgi:hypothetical protein
MSTVPIGQPVSVPYITFTPLPIAKRDDVAIPFYISDPTNTRLGLTLELGRHDVTYTYHPNGDMRRRQATIKARPDSFVGTPIVGTLIDHHPWS